MIAYRSRPDKPTPVLGRELDVGDMLSVLPFPDHGVIESFSSHAAGKRIAILTCKECERERVSMVIDDRHVYYRY